MCIFGNRNFDDMPVEQNMLDQYTQSSDVEVVTFDIGGNIFKQSRIISLR